MTFENQVNNKRIAKNTLLLYFRMLFMMTIQLYTSRVVLRTLGIEDFGIYNVVGGVVAMFGFLNSAMTSSTQRFLTFELGTGNFNRLQKVFSTSFFIHLLISVVVILLAETLGYWFLKEKMVIPEPRMDVAIYVFHLSILTTVVAIMSYPFNAAIVAHEKMSAFAYISIVEVSLKLGVVFLLTIGNKDKLLLYACLLSIIQIVICLIYAGYCIQRFSETKIHLVKDSSLFKEMLSFAGWNLWGNLASILFSQGLNILLNMFFGPMVNAARAISVQIQNALHQFSNNFQMALNPQITKTYAAGQLEVMHSLICRSSKFTFVLLFSICLPVIIETPMILNLWLKTVPEYTEIFVRVMLVTMIIDSSANPLMVSAAATGKVKKYQSIIGGLLLTIVPASYLVLKLGGAPWTVFVVHLFVCCVAFIVRLLIIRPMIGLSIKFFLKNVVIRCFLFAVVASLFPVIMHFTMGDGFLHSLVTIVFSVICAGCSGLCIGLDRHERTVVFSKLKRRFAK